MFPIMQCLLLASWKVRWSIVLLIFKWVRYDNLLIKYRLCLSKFLAKIYKNTSKKCKFNFIVAYVSSKSNRFYVKNILKAEIVVSTRQVLYLRMEEYKVSFYKVWAVAVMTAKVLGPFSKWIQPLLPPFLFHSSSAYCHRSLGSTIHHQGPFHP